MADIKQKDLFLELGDTGLKQYDGWIEEEFVRSMRSLDSRIEVFKEMADNDATVGAVLFAIKMLIKRVEWRVEEASEDLADLEAAEFLESCLHDMTDPWSSTIEEILSMLEFGFSYHETIYKRRMGENRDPRKDSRLTDGRIGWRKHAIRSQDTLWRWEFDEFGSLRGMVQQNPTKFNQVLIPIEKSLLFRPSAHKSNPEGRSVLRNAWRAWYAKKHIENIEGIAIEREGCGVPVITAPPEIMSASAPQAQKDIYASLKKIVQNIKTDKQQGIVLPASYDEHGNKQYSIELLTTGGRRSIDTSPVIQRYDRAIASTVMADFIFLGHEAHGSFALSSNKTSLFTTAIGAFLESITDVFNRVAVPRLFALNNLRVDKLPKIAYGDLETVDLQELGDYVTKLAGAGVQLFPDEKVENWLKHQGGFPVEQQEEFGEETSQDANLQPDNQDVFSDKNQLETTQGRTGELSMDEVKMLIDINSAVSSNRLARPNAVEIAERALGRPRREVELLVRREGAQSAV
jgi:hypothetical protein